MTRRFHDQFVSITGSSSGTERAAAFAFSRESAKVVLANRDKKGKFQVVDKIRSENGEAILIVTHITKSEKVKALVE